jgi:hypothetical protein
MKDVIVIGAGVETVEVNGVKYEKIEEKPFPIMGSKMTQLMAMSMMFGGMMGSNIKTPSRPNVDIVEEFKLIQAKKSNLSANNRAWVVAEFHRKFKLSTPPKDIRD